MLLFGYTNLGWRMNIVYLNLTPSQLRIQSLIKEFSTENILPLVDKIDQSDLFPGSIVKKMASVGIMGLPIPTKYMGQGTDFFSYILAIEQISKASATLGVILSVHTSVATMPILLAGNEEQKAYFLPKLAQGQYLGAFALTEQLAGSNPKAITTTAKKVGDSYILNGRKMFITNAGAADIYITFAILDSEKKSGITAFILQKDMPGIVISKKEKKMGLNGSNTCEIIFDNVKVPIFNRLGEELEGYNIALSILDAGRIGIAAQALGIASATFDFLMSQKKEFLYSNRLLLSELATKIEMARLLVYKSACCKDQNIQLKSLASMAKLSSSDLAVEITTQALNMIGYEGCIYNNPLQRYFRDAKVTQIYEGTNEIQRMVIAKELIGG